MLRLDVPLAAGYVLGAIAVAWNVAASFRSSGTLCNPNREVMALLRAIFDRAGQASIWWSAHYRYGSIPVALGWGGSTFEIQGTDLAEDVMARFFVKYPYLHCNDAFFDAHCVTHFLISKSEWPAEVYGSLEVLVRSNRIAAESDSFLILAREHS